jgi:hypothetical protein
MWQGWEEVNTSGVTRLNAQMLFDERSRIKESLITHLRRFLPMNEESDVK